MSEVTTIETPLGPAKLIRTKRKTLAISVLPDGCLELTAPLDAPEAEIVARVVKKLPWIVRKRREFEEMNRNRAPLRYESGATHRYLGRQYRLKVSTGDTTGVRLVGAYFQIVSRTGEPKDVERLLTAWYREKAEEQFERRLRAWDKWCHDRSLPTPRLHVLTMPKRWGSADPSGRVALNPELVKAPSICIDYVIAHEICHLLHPVHNGAFFQQLEQVFPNWREVKARLEQCQ